MKSLFIFLFILFFPLLTFCQIFGVGTTENEFLDYFDKHATTLDSLEGLWIKTSKSIKSTYAGSGLASSKEDASQQTIVIVKGKNGFTEFNMVKEVCTFILKKNTCFSNTAEKNKYILTINYDPDKQGEISSFTIKGSDFHIEYSWTSDNRKDYDNSYNTYNKTHSIQFISIKTTVKEDWHKIYPN